MQEVDGLFIEFSDDAFGGGLKLGVGLLEQAEIMSQLLGKMKNDHPSIFENKQIQDEFNLRKLSKQGGTERAPPFLKNQQIKHLESPKIRHIVRPPLSGGLKHIENSQQSSNATLMLLQNDYSQELFDPLYPYLLKHEEPIPRQLKLQSQALIAAHQNGVRTGDSRKRGTMIRPGSAQVRTPVGLTSRLGTPGFGSAMRSRKQQRHEGTVSLEKERLKEEIQTVKAERNQNAQENILLKTQIKTLDKELKRKDQLIRQLIDNFRQQSPKQTKADDILVGGAAINLPIDHSAFKLKIKSLQLELLSKQEELGNITRNLKFTRVRELEERLFHAQQEIQRAKDEMRQRELEQGSLQGYKNEVERIKKLYEKQISTIQVMQQEIGVLTRSIDEKTIVISTLTPKLNKFQARAKWYKDRFLNTLKKVKVLQSRLPDQQNNKTEIKNDRGSQSPNRSTSNGRRSRSAKQRGVKQSDADWFEKYIIEKTNVERIIANLQRLGIQLPHEELFKNVKFPIKILDDFNCNSPKTANTLELRNIKIERSINSQKDNISQIGAIENIAKEIRIKMQIKRIPQELMFKYIMQGVSQVKPVTSEILQSQLTSRLSISQNQAKLFSNNLFSKQDIKMQRSKLKSLLLQLISPYTPYQNGSVITRLLTRLTATLENHREKLEDALRKEDIEGDGEVSMSKVWEIIGKLNIVMEADVKEFMEYLVFRLSDSITKMNYYSFLEIFDEDYLIEESPYEDIEEYQPSDLSEQSIDQMQKFQTEESSNEDDMMLMLDSVLMKVCSRFLTQCSTLQDQEQIIAGLRQTIGPYLQQRNVRGREVIYILLTENFQSYLNQCLGLSLNSEELSYINRVLFRINEGLIYYQDFESIVMNYIHKELAFTTCINQGLRYDLITHHDTLEFLFKLKQLSSALKIRNGIFDNGVITKQTVQNNKLQSSVIVEVLDFDQMLSHLAMRHGLKLILSPLAKCEIQTLLCIDQKHPQLIMLNKLERVIYQDFEIIYVNLLHLTRDPNFAQRYQQKRQTFLSSQLDIPSDVIEEESSKQPSSSSGDQPFIKLYQGGDRGPENYRKQSSEIEDERIVQDDIEEDYEF